MDLFEYQARDLFAKHGVPVLAGEVIDTPEAAREITERLGGKSVVKAQVKVGGRGKAGGVKLAATPDEAVARATDILGMDIKGHTVHKVMIAETAPEIVEEYYVSFLLDRANRTFLSIASHDLRSPLGAILGLTELVRDGVFTSLEEQRHAIDRIYANTQYMLSLTNSLLGQAQIEAGILQLRPAPFYPDSLIGAVVSAMEVLAQDKGIELVAHIDDDLPDIITGDQERLSQVLFNLVGNGIKFTDKGTVQVRAYVQEEGRWALAVSDTGLGIPEEAHAIIFEPFHWVETTSAAGAGLGLSIVKQLVELMDGEILLESQVEKGSTFTIVLPIEQY